MMSCDVIYVAVTLTLSMTVSSKKRIMKFVFWKVKSIAFE